MRSRFPAVISAQALLGVVAFATLALWPPRRGPMLLISLRGVPADTLDAAIAGHATLLGRGPLPGSVIVLGDRARIGGRTVLAVAATPALCGYLADAGAPA